MCGFWGEYFVSGKTEINDKAYTDYLHRRGPDASTTVSIDECCTFGFRRLSVLDIDERSNQPFTSADSHSVLVFNGEVYNYKELKKDKSAKSAEYRTTSDTEVVSRLLDSLGVGALEKFNGMFALARYDTASRELLLARDYPGIKPLYYMIFDDGIVFSSQLDHLLRHPRCRKRSAADLAGLSMYATYGFNPTSVSLVKDVMMLEPGKWLKYSQGSVEFGTHWRYRSKRNASQIDQDIISGTIKKAVTRQLISDVPVGAFLSGGVDSPLVAAFANEHTSTPAFTLGVDSTRYDETAAAEQYARELGLKHFVESIDESSVLDLLDDVVTAQGEPSADYSIFPTMLISKFARRFVTVALSGDGGDELFWGYYGRFASVLAIAQQFRYPAVMRHGMRAMTRYMGMGTFSRNIRFRSIGDWYRAKHTKIWRDLQVEIFPDLAMVDDHDPAFEFNGWRQDEVADWLRRTELERHLPMILQKVDRASMYYSLEVRVPLLDQEVVRMAEHLHWQECIDLKTGIGKIPLRNTLAQFTPFQTKMKKGFGVPMEDWLAGPLRQYVHAYLLDRREFLGLDYRADVVERLYASHLRGDTSYTSALWSLLSLAFWEAKHLKCAASVV